MSAGQDDGARDPFDELCAGWTNRETYAAHLHLTADEGLVGTALRSLQVVEVVEGVVTPETAGRTLSGLLDRFLDELDDAGLGEEQHAICQDIGSLWRVDWTELGASFLQEHNAA